MPELERRFVKGDVVKMVGDAELYGTGTVIEHIDNDPYHYWVRVGEEFADVLPFKDEELEKADA